MVVMIILRDRAWKVIVKAVVAKVVMVVVVVAMCICSILLRGGV